MQRTTRWSMTLLASLALISSGALAEDKKPDKKIERLWKAKCSSCHGMDGKAQTDKGKQMKVADYSTAAWQKSRTDEQIKKGIIEGVKLEKDGVKQEMDGYKTELTAEQIDGLVQFTRSLGPK